MPLPAAIRALLVVLGLRPARAAPAPAPALAAAPAAVPLLPPLEPDSTRALLDQLLDESRLYSASKDYLELLEFIARFRGFAPFNAMLLHIQKPGLTHAASARDWYHRFGRRVKQGSRPLLILWPFGPIALVYDILDTEGRRLPEGAFAFAASGAVTKQQMDGMLERVREKGIVLEERDYGDGAAGLIRREGKNRFVLELNRNHEPATRFGTLVHELAHLYLGHLGAAEKPKVPDRGDLTEGQCELEAESISYLICKRQGMTTASHAYLMNYVAAHTTVESLDLHTVLRVAGQIEALLGLGRGE